jgi:flavin reductase (DIM6/NTAB) family NADH-FMN oxidoreductase RutF
MTTSTSASGDSFDLAGLSHLDRYKLICAIVVPRPIALVTSIDEEGRVNAAPYSFFNAFSEDPPQIALGLQHKSDLSPKDTTRNLANARHFVVNMVDEPLAQAMSDCAIDFPPDVSEVTALGIETAPSTHVPVPRIAAAPFALECRKTVSLAFSPTREILIGEILAIHARPGLVDREKLYIDHMQYRPVGRLFGTRYCRQGEIFELARPTYAEWLARQHRSE